MICVVLFYAHFPGRCCEADILVTSSLTIQVSEVIRAWRARKDNDDDEVKTVAFLSSNRRAWMV